MQFYQPFGALHVCLVSGNHAHLLGITNRILEYAKLQNLLYNDLMISDKFDWPVRCKAGSWKRRPGSSIVPSSKPRSSVRCSEKKRQWVGQLAPEYGVYSTMLYCWGDQALVGLPSLFSDLKAQELAQKEVVDGKNARPYMPRLDG